MLGAACCDEKWQTNLMQAAQFWCGRTSVGVVPSMVGVQVGVDNFIGLNESGPWRYRRFDNDPPHTVRIGSTRHLAGRRHPYLTATGQRCRTVPIGCTSVSADPPHPPPTQWRGPMIGIQWLSGIPVRTVWSPRKPCPCPALSWCGAGTGQARTYAFSPFQAALAFPLRWAPFYPSGSPFRQRCHPSRPAEPVLPVSGRSCLVRGWGPGCPSTATETEGAPNGRPLPHTSAKDLSLQNRSSGL